MALRRNAVVFGVFLAILAFALRFAAGRVLGGESVWDGHYYEYYAGRIADGFGYTDKMVVDGIDVGHPSCHYPVGYSAFLAVFYKIFGHNLVVARLFDASVGTALALVTWRLGRYALSEARAGIAGALVALHPGLVLYGALTMSEPLSSLLTLISFWLRVRTRDPKRAMVYSALVLGVAALVRPPVLLCAPFLIAFPAPATATAPQERERPASRRFFHAASALALVVAFTLLPILPWTARNCARMDGCALVSTNGGWNLAIGAFPRATGRFETLKSADGCRDVTGQVQQDRCWFKYGVSYIKSEPGRWLSLLPKKWSFTFDHESFQVEYLHQAKPDMWPDPKRELGRKALTLAHSALLACAAFAAVRLPSLRKRRPERTDAYEGIIFAGLGLATYFSFQSNPVVLWPLLLLTLVLFGVFALPHRALAFRSPESLAMKLALVFAASIVVTHGIFFGEDRYHVVLTPVLCLLAAGALRSKNAPPAAGAVGGAGALRRGVGAGSAFAADEAAPPP